MTINRGAVRTAGTASRWTLLLGLCLLVILTGCSGKKDKGASQTAAKVNKEEITVHQINFVLQRQRGLKPEQMDAASHQVLERLIDQELAVQKAEDMGLDRDANVIQQIEAAKRDILARAYFERVSEGASKPAPEAVKAFYEARPELFKDRHVYNVQEVSIQAPADAIDGLRSAAEATHNAGELVDYLKAHDMKYAANQLLRAAEQLPTPTLKLLSGMKEGQVSFNRTPTGAQVVYLMGARSLPMTLEQATPLIERHLANEKRRDLVLANLKQLRQDAKIEYVGKFQAAASAPTPEAEAEPEVAGASEPVLPAAPAAAPPASAASGSLDNSAIMKGLGIK